ncbi:MAG TPA: hypothetical protein VFP00_02175, partial [Burkholderiales bacterium]|nr:hypothetical protein [Burkholderiales bacterium]
MRLPRIALASIYLLVALPGGAACAASKVGTAAEARNELKELRARIETLQKQLHDAEGSRTEAVDSLKASERAISDANRRLRDLANEANELNRQLDALRSSARDRESSLRRQQALLERLLYQQYVAGRSEPLKLLLNGEDPNRIARNLYYFGHIARARAETIDAVRKGLAQ